MQYNYIRYFAPPGLKSGELMVMLQELGMLSSLTGDYLLRIAKDIEDSVSLDSSKGSSNTIDNAHIQSSAGAVREDMSIEYSEILIQEAGERGRKLLRFIKQDDNSSEFFSAEFCRKLRVIQFVPMNKPIKVEQGGHVTYKQSLGSFDELLAHIGIYIYIYLFYIFVFRSIYICI
jgi:hypothetical protein